MTFVDFLRKYHKMTLDDFFCLSEPKRNSLRLEYERLQSEDWYDTIQKSEVCKNMDGLATDVLREMKRKLKHRMIIIVISIVFLFVTNMLWFIVWNQPPKEKDDFNIVEIEDEEDETPQSENEKSE